MNRSLKTFGLVSAGLILAFGRYPVSWLVSSKNRLAAPKRLKSIDQRYIRSSTGNTLYVEIEGPESAQPLVLLHGLNGSREQWFYQRSMLRGNYRLIIVDLPGHGKSPAPVSLAVKDLARDLAAIVSELSLIKPVLYGHSLGAMTAMEYCSTYPNDVKAAILQHCSYTNPYTTCQASWLVEYLQEPVIRPYLEYSKKHPLLFRLLTRLNYMNGLSILFHRYIFFKGEQSASQLRFISRIAAFCPPEVTAEGLLRCMDFEMSARLKKITAPCLVIGAADDRLTRAYAGKHIAKNVKRGEYALVEGGHLSLMEHADKVNDLVAGFLARNR
ncbi:alpha/beta fold hydrolase [Arcticibacter sp.]|uniref:alpha/beta fold hydrolase n=1 Tax=Arcticibacter sp. TaxID=1872630 RepID=UPI00389116FB